MCFVCVACVSLCLCLCLWFVSVPVSVSVWDACVCLASTSLLYTPTLLADTWAHGLGAV